MGLATEFLSFFNKVAVLVGISAVVLGFYVEAHKEDAAEHLHLFSWASGLLIAVGVIAITISLIGCCAASSENRGFHGVYFLAMLSLFTCVIVVTTASAANLPMVEAFLEKKCNQDPWPNCNNELPRILDTVKANLHTLFFSASTVAASLATLMFLTVLAAGETRKRHEYYEIRSGIPQQFVVA